MATLPVTIVLEFTAVLDETIEQPRRMSSALDNAVRAVEIKTRTGVTFVGVSARTAAQSN